MLSADNFTKEVSAALASSNVASSSQAGAAAVAATNAALVKTRSAADRLRSAVESSTPSDAATLDEAAQSLATARYWLQRAYQNLQSIMSEDVKEGGSAYGESPAAAGDPGPPRRGQQSRLASTDRSEKSEQETPEARFVYEAISRETGQTTRSEMRARSADEVTVALRAVGLNPVWVRKA